VPEVLRLRSADEPVVMASCQLVKLIGLFAVTAESGGVDNGL